MKSSARLRVRDFGEEHGREVRAPFELRRGAVLSYEQIVAGTGLLRRVARPLVVMPAPPARVEADRERRQPAQPPPQPRSYPAAEDLARDPLAHPMAPARPERAARPVYEVVPGAGGAHEALLKDIDAALLAKKQEAPVQPKRVESLVVEPPEPSAEPRNGPARSVHGSVDVPERSMLSPSQRASLRRPETRLDRNKQTTYVTYTVDTGSKK